MANELRQQEKKHQSKVQQRQKRQLQLKRLQDRDPIKLYWQIQKLEQKDKVGQEVRYLQRLKDDWKFIVSNKIHKEKVDKFLKNIEEEEKRKKKEQNRLWGQKSIYFNPELNPLGKVPGDGLSNTAKNPFPNLTKPLKKDMVFHYKEDPDIKSLGIALPEGSPPRFYKLVQNIPKSDHGNVIESEAMNTLLKPTIIEKASLIDSGGDNDNNGNCSEGNEDVNERDTKELKRQKID